MEEPRSSSSQTSTSEVSSSSSSSPPTPPPLPSSPREISLVQPSHKKKHKQKKVVRVFRSVFRSLPILSPTCKFPSIPSIDGHNKNVNANGGVKISGTLFGYRKGRVSLSIQETPKCLPSLVVELSMYTNALQKEMAAGMVRVALECEKRPEKDKTKLVDEPLWTMFCNGKKNGYGVKREATEEDLYVMELLKAVSMGAGVLPLKGDADDVDADQLAYMRAPFEHVVGSKDSETLYMLSPEGNSNTGPDLTIFFVRL